MSNCLSRNSSCIVLKPNPTSFVKNVRHLDYVLNVNLQFKQIFKIQHFKNVDCFKLNENLIFSKEHFSKKNFAKLKDFTFDECKEDVVSFFDKNGNEIETLPIGLLHCFL